MSDSTEITSLTVVNNVIGNMGSVYFVSADYRSKSYRDSLGIDHNGIDFPAADTSVKYTITAIADGVVYAAVNDNGNKGFGTYIRIQHGDSFVSTYGHMRYDSITVKKGDTVSKGQIIGIMGNTGYCKSAYTDGTHLHFQVEQIIDGNFSGNYVDPKQFLTGKVDIVAGYSLSDSVSLDYTSWEGIADTSLSVVDKRNLLSPSTEERMYGPAIAEIEQELIRCATASGINSSSGVDISSLLNSNNLTAASYALQQYSKYLFYLSNFSTSMLSATLVSMPWLRPGMNCWFDPIHIDKVFYITAVSHSGSPEGGVMTSVQCAMGRNRKSFQSGDGFGALNSKVSENVFISNISINTASFGPVMDSSDKFEAAYQNMIKFYKDGKERYVKALNNQYFCTNFYGTKRTLPIGADSLSHTDEEKITSFDKISTASISTPALLDTSKGISLGDTIIFTGYLYGSSFGDYRGKYLENYQGKITRIVDKSRFAPYTIDQLGWIQEKDITLTKSATTTSTVSSSKNVKTDIYKVNTNRLNVRQFPTIYSTSLKIIVLNDEIKAYSGSESSADGYEWLKIFFNDGVAYVAKKYLTYVSSIKTPVVTKETVSKTVKVADNKETIKEEINANRIDRNGRGYYSNADEIQKILTDMYKSAPNIIQQRKNNLKQNIIPAADEYIKTHYVKER